MARCGCSSDCSCAVRSGAGARVVGNGTPGSPYIVSVLVDPDPANILEADEDGLFVSLPTPAVVSEETDCIDMEGTGTPVDPLRASPRIDPVPSNTLSCGPDGMLVSAIGSPLYEVIEVEESYGAELGQMLLVYTTGGDVTITLPSLPALFGIPIVIKKMSAANTLTIEASGGELIDGVTSRTLSTQWASVILVTTGSMWVRAASI